MDITQCLPNRVCVGRVGREKAHGQPRMCGQPWRDILGLMDRIVIDHHRESRIRFSWRVFIELGEQVEQGVGYARPQY